MAQVRAAVGKHPADMHPIEARASRRVPPWCPLFPPFTSGGPIEAGSEGRTAGRPKRLSIGGAPFSLARNFLASRPKGARGSHCRAGQP